MQGKGCCFPIAEIIGIGYICFRVGYSQCIAVYGRICPVGCFADIEISGKRAEIERAASQSNGIGVIGTV